MTLALLLLALQTVTGSSCGPGGPGVAVEEGWIHVELGSDESANQVRVRVWGPWIHETSFAQLDSDPEEEFFVISRTTGTGPYYRMQILDFKCEGEGAGREWGVLSWSYWSEGKPRIEGDRVLLGQIPVDLWSSKGPSSYRSYRLTTDGLVVEARPPDAGRAGDCEEIPPSFVSGARSGPVVSFTVGVFPNGERARVVLTTTIEQGAEGECPHPKIVLENAEGSPLGGAELPGNYCGGVGLWSAKVWELVDGGALAALEFGNVLTKSAAGDLYILYFGRNGSVWKLADFAEVSGSWASGSGGTVAEATSRLYQVGSSTVIAVAKTRRSAGRMEDEPDDGCAASSVDWFELSSRRDELLPLPSDRAPVCADPVTRVR